MGDDLAVGNATAASRALFAACRLGSADAVPKLCAATSAEADVADALTCASAHGHAACVSALLACDGVHASSAALVAASAAGHATCASLLLDKGAPKDDASPSGLTPLAVACAGGHDACVELLLEHGADADRPGAIPHSLHIARPTFAPAAPCHVCLGLLADAVALSEDKSARRVCACSTGAPAVDVTMRQEGRRAGLPRGLHVEWTTSAHHAPHASHARPSRPHARAYTASQNEPRRDAVRAGPVLHPLRVAVEREHTACTRLLLRRGADPVTVDMDTSTPLSIACARGDVECTRALLEAFPAEARLTHRNALVAACRSGHAECVRLLLAAGASVVAPFIIDDSSVCRHAACVDLLVQAGAKRPPPPRPRAQDVPIIAATRARDPARVRVLVRQGVDVNQLDNLGRTALHHALQHVWSCDAQECARLLCAHGAKLDEKMTFPDRWAWMRDACEAGPSPLHRLRLQPKTRDVWTLLQAGWDVDAPGGTEEAPTPIDVARQLADDPDLRPRARLLLAAARWSPRWHKAFPKEMRRQAEALLVLGHAMAKRLGSYALLDVWKTQVIPLAVVRQRRLPMTDEV